MNRYLLDTHTFLWWLQGNKRLNTSIKDIIADPQNKIFASVINAWEISIKLKKNPNFTIKRSLEKTFELSEFELLPVRFDHAITLQKLASHHKDPFDRMLIAQAKTEKLILITADKNIWKYRVSLLKIK